MIHSSRAQVLPLYFEGQCSPLFQFVSKFSLTLRLALIIREFRVRVGQPLRVHVGDVIPPEACQEIRDRQALMMMLYERVHALGGLDADEVRLRMEQLPDWLRKL
jgi:putative hemolysin